MIRLVVFDVDGTLLSHETWTIPQSAIDSIHELQNKGIKIAIASGRPIYALNNVTNHGIKPDYVIGCNGHAVYDEDGTLIAARTFTFEQAEQLTHFLCEEHNYILTFKFSKGNYVYNRSEDLLELHRKLQIDNSSLHVDCSRSHHKEELPFGAVTYLPQAQADEYVRTRDPNLVFLPFDVDSFDVSIRGTTKGWGLEQLLHHIGVKTEECMAFGDALNDVEMIQMAGIGVAMKRCVPELLKVCDYHTDDILEDGIQHALEHYQLIEKRENR